MLKDCNELGILYVKDLMEVLHIGRDKAYSLMRSKAFPSTQLGKNYFVTIDNLNKWLDDNAGRNYKL